MDKIAVLIPCYNESQTIAKVDRCGSSRGIERSATIHGYDNNSSDHTDEIAREAGAVVRYEYQQGKGNVIRSMFRDIDAECYVMTDGDDTYPAEDARKLADQILQGKADMVIGDRLSSTYFTENKRPFHNTGNRLVRGLINLIFKSNIKDIMTGARAFNYEFVKSFPILSTGFEIETEMSIHALDKNFKLVEIPVGYRDRPEGSVSKLFHVFDGFGGATHDRETLPGLQAICVLWMAGTHLFCDCNGIFRAGAWRLSGNRHGVSSRPDSQSSGLYVISFLLWISGVILEVITKKHRQLFELYLNQLSILKRRDG